MDARIITFPDLSISERLDRLDTLEISNAVLGSVLEAPRCAMEVLEFFRTARTVEEFLQHTTRARPAMQPLVDSLRQAHILVRAEELEALEGGLLRPSSEPVGAACSIQQFLRMSPPPHAVIIGAPIDIATGGRGGARHGPSEIRKYMPEVSWSPDGAVAPDGSDSGVPRLIDFDFRRTYTAELPTVRDLGNVAFTPGERNETVGLRIRRIVELALQQSSVPIVLGGDHSITWFVLQAIVDRHGPVGLIHFDAHADLYPPKRGILHHGNPFVFALEAGFARILFQVGLRGLTPVPFGISPQQDERIAYVSAMELRKSSPEKVFQSLPTDIPYYLTFDVDCLAPHVAAETGAPVSGGLNFYQALELIDYATRHFNFVGADFVEVTGAERWENTAAVVTARLLTQFLLRDTRFEPLKGYYVKGSTGRIPG